MNTPDVLPVCLAAMRHARRMFHGPDRDDIAQEAALKVLASTVKTPARIAAMQAGADWLRRFGPRSRSGFERVMLHIDDMPRYEPHHEDDQEHETERTVRAILDDMRPDQAELLRSTYMQGRPVGGKYDKARAPKARMARNAFEKRWLEQKHRHNRRSS